MEIYKRWVRRNRDYVHSLESLANGLTWLLPERFSESEIGPEAVTSILGVMTSINDHILDTTPVQTYMGPGEPSSFPLSLCITLLKDLETLVEVVALQIYGEEKKWNFIAITETIKVFLRLAMLQNSGYKMLLQGGENVNDGSDSGDLNLQRNGILPNPSQNAVPGFLKNDHAQTPRNLEGKAVSALSRFGENARTVYEPTWFRRVQHQQAVMEPPWKVTKTTPSLSIYLSEKGINGGFLLMGEMMFILRPLVYVFLIRKYGAQSWFPWLTSLALDLTGNGIVSYVTSFLQNSNHSHLTNSERNELRRRKLLWALYLMRDPFFTKYTRKRLDGAQKILEPVPIVGLLTEKLVELLVGAQTRYTYMSGS